MKLDKKVIIGGGAAALVVIIGAMLFFTGQDPVKKRFESLEGKPVSSTADDSVLDSLKWKDLGEGARIIEGELTFEQTVALLRKKYGATINHPLTQMRMLEELLKYLQKKYPDNWVEYLHEILGAAFPELANKLFVMSKNLYLYDKFLNESKTRASLMTDKDRGEFLWDKRRELFGSDADQIWAAEKQYNDVQTALAEIGANKNTSVKEKLGQYKEALQKSYGEQLPSIMENRRQNFVDSFVDVVQDDLHNMTSEQRREVLRDVRSTLGMDALALSRWDELDKERDQRWSNGSVYMAERKQIMSQYSGEEREKKLDEVRKKLFGEEGETIKNEEASGFYRFEGKQQFGTN
jgi:hypothetical protein